MPAEAHARTAVGSRGRRGRGVEVRPGSIREARLQAGMTMAQLAGEELTRGAIYLFEVGRARPSRDTLDLIVRRTGRPLSFFLEPESIQLGAGSPLALATLELAALEGRHERALELVTQLLEVALEARIEARVRLHAARAEVALKRLEAALVNARHALRLSEAAESDPWLEIECRVAEAEVLHLMGDPACLQEVEAALERGRSLKPARGDLEARILMLLGSIHTSRESWKEAAQAYLSVFEARAVDTVLRTAAAGHEAAALAQERSAQPTEALASTLRAATLRALRQQLLLAGEAGMDLGLALRQSGDIAGANRAFQETLAYCESLGLSSHRCHTLLALADLALTTGGVGTARSYVQAALETAIATGDMVSVGLAHLLGGRLSTRDRNRRAADQEFGEAIRIFSELGALDRLIQAHAVYADVLESRGAIKKALEHWKQATSLVKPELRAAASREKAVEAR